MANIPGGQGLLPQVVTNVVTQSTGVSVPGGLRVAAIIGTGQRSEIIIASAVGGGSDGFNPTYTSSTNGTDGRHFLLTFSPIISNRTQLFRNGFPLVGLEAQIDNNSFPNQYDYRIDIATGRIELQRAHLVNQAGTEAVQIFYVAGVTNVGQGSIQNLTLPDLEAPTETWTVKCVSVQRNNLNQPIAGTARFVAFGSVSGNVLDANGNTVVWIANNTVATNGILSFSILETAPSFREGDFFTIKVSSGVLLKNDSLTANYIAVGDINSPTFFTTMPQITTKHGPVSLDNTLSLGCQLAFANSTPGIMCVQAAPPLPRRTSYEMEFNFNALSANCNDFIIPFPVGVTPDINSSIHVFVTNPTTLVETQLLPNKFPFFTLDTPGNPTTCTFVFDNSNPPAGNSFSYSVNQSVETLNFGQDGYLSATLTSQTNAQFSSASVHNFDGSYVNKNLVIIDAVNNANIGTFVITAVSNDVLTITATGTPPFSDFVTDATSTIQFNLFNPTTGLAIATGADGSLTMIGGTATGTFHSSAVNFNNFTSVPLTDLQLQIVTSTTSSTNIGYFDIISNTVSGGSITIAKTFVSEHNLKFEVQDPAQTSSYLVLNHNVVPNGYNLRVTIVDKRDAAFFDAGWELALFSLETQEIDILVTLPKQTISAIFENALIHCQTMSNIRFKKERVLFLGTINGLIPANLTGAQLAAVEDLGVLEGIQGNTVAEILAGNTEDLANYSVPAAYGNTFRAVYFFPDQIVVQVGTQNQIIDGFYIAAAAAGFECGQANVAVPLTNKVISGFTILQSRQFNQTTYEQLAAAGVTSLSPVAGGGLVLWGKTTTQSGFPEEEEISIVFIRDAIAKALRKGFNGFIGLPEDQDMVSTLLVRATSLLNGFISQKLITNFAGLSVARDSVEPRQWNIGVKVQPTYPVNWIYISVGIGTI